MPLSALASNECPTKSEVDESVVASSIPNGPSCSIRTDQVDPQPGDSVFADWSNVTGSSVFRPVVNWFVNGAPFDENVKSPGSTIDTLNTSGLNPGDQIQARVNYRTRVDEVIGTGFSASSELPTNDEVNSAVVMENNLPAGNSIPSKDEIIDAAKKNGTAGSLSNTIVLT